MSNRIDSKATLSGEINLRKDHIDAALQSVERRARPRLRQPFPAMVAGIDTQGRRFELDTQLGNMSSTGLYLRLPRHVDIGEELSLLIRFSNGVSTGATAIVAGRVLRVDRGLDGLNGLGIAIMKYEFV